MENKENIFTRFINFIKKILGNKEPKKLSEKAEEIQEQKAKKQFLDELKLNNAENSELLKLQNQYENGEINLSILSDEQIHDLNLLYKKQVSDLKQKLNEKKLELRMMKQKVNNYSANA